MREPPPTTTTQWIAASAAGKYPRCTAVVAHCAEALSAFPSLRPKMDTFTSDGGDVAVLLALAGTLPVSFRGSVYNIPVCVWLPLSYPTHPPLAFVTPTQNMLVRAGRHVDASGRVYHPLLAQWHALPERDISITALLAAMQNAFAIEPPVYAKPAIPTQPSPSNATPGGRSPPPIPINPLKSASPHPVSAGQAPAIPSKTYSTGGAPTVPPKSTVVGVQHPQQVISSPPPVPLNPLTSQQNLNGPYRSASQPLHPSQSATPPPVPPPPSQLSKSFQSVSNSQHAAANYQQGVPPVPPPPSKPANPYPQPGSYGSNFNIQQPIPTYSTAQNAATFLAGSPSRSPNLTTYQQFGHHGQQQLYQQQQQQPPQYTQPSSDTLSFITAQPVPIQYHTYPQQQQYQLQSNHGGSPLATSHFPLHSTGSPAPHLITPVTANLPAGSPTASAANAQHIAAAAGAADRDRRTRDQRAQLAQRIAPAARDLEASLLRDFERMRANGVVVLEGEARVRSVLAALQAEEVKVKRNAEVLAAKGVEMHGVMERLAAQGEVDVDEILGAGSVVQNQLLEVIAEEHALDDSIYYLGKALNAEKVELAAFMKHTRVLARELFFKRALLKKIQLLIQMNT